MQVSMLAPPLSRGHSPITWLLPLSHDPSPCHMTLPYHVPLPYHVAPPLSRGPSHCHVAPPPADVSGSSEALQRTLTSIANVRPEAVFEPPVLAPTLSLPIIKVQQPTVRRKPRPLQQQGKMSQSVEDLTQGGPLPPSPQVIKRPQSRAIMTAERKNDLLPSKIATPPKRPKSTNPSPSVRLDGTGEEDALVTVSIFVSY